MYPKLSIILRDWGVRESYHAVSYLNRQTLPRRDYEIIWVEYTSWRPRAIQEFVNQGKIDKWLVLGKKDSLFPHLMHNEGIVASEGEIIATTDSDAVFRETFVENIVRTFEEHAGENIVLYLDQLRSQNRQLYPFPFSGLTFDQILDIITKLPGLDNWDSEARKPSGLTSLEKVVFDIPIKLNYASCFCARRQDIIEAGGLDEDESYHCFMGGPYELGWRMVNKGFKEIWHQNEWLIHTYHPGAGVGGAIKTGSHIWGIHTTALMARQNKRIAPLQENPKIRQLRGGTPLPKQEENNPIVSIVVPCVDMPRITKKCVDLISRNTPPIYELIIVCDRPGREMREWLSSLEATGKARIIINPEPVGSPSAINMGFRAAKANYIAVVNNDIEVHAAWLEKLIELLMRYPKTGWAAARVNFTDTVMTFGCPLSLFSREALEKVELLDESFSPGIGADDDDHYRRFLLAGYEPHGLLQSIGDHPHSETTFQALHGDKGSPAYLGKYNRNRQLLYNKWGTSGTNWDLVPFYG